MVRYRRNYLSGGTYFFTVTLANRRSTVLVDRIDDLRAAFQAQLGRPIEIALPGGAIVRLDPHVDPDSVRRVLSALARPTC